MAFKAEKRQDVNSVCSVFVGDIMEYSVM